MSTLRVLCSAVFAAVMVAGLSSAQNVSAQSQKEYVPKAKITPLVQKALPGVEGREVLIRQFELPPNFVGGKHWHPGPVYVYVLEGELTVETEDGTKTFKAGEVYEEPIKRAMQGKNLSSMDPVKLVVFQIGEAGQPMMVKAD